MAEPPPGVGATYRDFRRALAAVREARQRIVEARTALWPRDLREWLHIGFGATALASVLVGLGLALMTSSSRPAVRPLEVAAEEPRQVAEIPGTWGPVKGVSNKADTDDSSNGDEKPQRPMRQERNGSSSKDDEQKSTKERPSLVLQLGHSQGITCAAFSPDGKQVLTGSLDHSARLWDVDSGKEIRAFQEHQQAVMSVAFSPDGTKILTGEGAVIGDKGAYYRVCLWDAASGKVIHVFHTADSAATSVAFSPDGKQVLAKINSKTVRLWDVSSGEEIRSFEEHLGGVKSVTFAPDGKQVLTGGEKMLRLWDIASDREVRTYPLRHNSKGVRMSFETASSVAISPNGKQILTIDPKGSALLLDAASGEEIRSFGRGVQSVAFSSDGKQVLTKEYMRACLWDTASGKEMRAFEGLGTGRDILSRGILSAVLSPNGKQILVVEGDFRRRSAEERGRLWDVASGKEIRVFQGDIDPVIKVEFSPDGKQMVVKRNASTALWDTANARKIKDFKGPWVLLEGFNHLTPSQRMAVSPDLKRVVSWGMTRAPTNPWQNTIHLWDTSTSKEIHSFPVDIPNKIQTGVTHVSDVRFSQDGNKLLIFCTYTGSSNEKGVGLWDAATGKMIRTFIFLDVSNLHSINSVALSPDGTQILAAGFNKAFKQTPSRGLGTGFVQGLRDNESWSVTRGDVVLWDVASGRAIRRFHDAARLDAWMRSVGFSPDGKLVFAYRSDGRTQIFDAASGKPICVLAQSKGEAFAFSSDGKQVLTGGNKLPGYGIRPAGKKFGPLKGIQPP